jgi:4-hydroxy-tetrahydrodipicolinate synthase
MTGPLTKDDIKGIIPPLVSTFAADETLDLDAFRRELEYVQERGAVLVAVGGSTGDGEVLSVAELAELCRVATEESSLGVIAGVISTSTRDAIVRARAAHDAGASALMVTPPIYHQTSPENLHAFYSDIADAVPLPIMIYNILTHAPVAPETIARLAEIDAVIAIKESSGGTIPSLEQLLLTVKDQLAVIWAIDSLLFEGFALGADGSISAINTMYPTESIELFEAVQQGDLARARALHMRLAPLMRLTDVPVDWPSRVKLVLRLQGRDVGCPRRPYASLPASVEEAIAQAVRGVRPLEESRR